MQGTFGLLAHWPITLPDPAGWLQDDCRLSHIRCTCTLLEMIKQYIYICWDIRYITLIYACALLLHIQGYILYFKISTCTRYNVCPDWLNGCNTIKCLYHMTEVFIMLASTFIASKYFIKAMGGFMESFFDVKIWRLAVNLFCTKTHF
jgi:hypothetical protein